MKLKRNYTYDLILRICHWALAFFCLTLIATAWGAELFEEEGLYRKAFWIIHIFSGYGLVSALALRLFWGVIGPKHSKLKELWKWNEWTQTLKSRNLHIEWDWGHHPLAAFSYIGLYLALILLALSGIFLAAIEHNQGPLANLLYDEVLIAESFEALHEALAWFIPFFILTHLGALVWHEKNDEIPVAQSMVSGYQYRNQNKEENS